MGLSSEYHMGTADTDCIDIASQSHSTLGQDPSLSRDPMLSSTGSSLLTMTPSARFLGSHRTVHQYSSSPGLSDPPLAALVSNGHQQSAQAFSFSSISPGYSPSGSIGVYQGPSLGLVNSRSTTSHPITSSSLISPRSTPSQPSSHPSSSLRDIYFNTSIVNRTTVSPRSQSDQLSRSSFDHIRGSGLSSTGISMPPTSSTHNYSTPTMPPNQPQYTPTGNPDRGAMSSLENATPIFQDQTSLVTIVGEAGQVIHPLIEAQIEKGFFLSADKCWTCYRRNYFAVLCSFTLTPQTPHERLYVESSNGRDQIRAFGMTLSAVVVGTSDKIIELIQHTPKRDKGPQLKVEIEKVAPTLPGKSHQTFADHSFAGASYHNNYSAQSSLPALPILPLQSEQYPTMAAPSMYGSSGMGLASGQSLMGQAQPAPPRDSHTFERIQFKSATANNGKRRAAQQYYHLIVELHADICSPGATEPNWVKVAQRFSPPVVVRGRSPSHYHNEGPQNQSRGGGNMGDGNGVLHSNRASLTTRSFPSADFVTVPMTTRMRGSYRPGPYSSVGSHSGGSGSLTGASVDGSVYASYSITPYQTNPANPFLSDDSDTKFAARSQAQPESHHHYYQPTFDTGAASGTAEIKPGDGSQFTYDTAPVPSQDLNQPYVWGINGATNSSYGRFGDPRSCYPDTNSSGGH